MTARIAVRTAVVAAAILMLAYLAMRATVAVRWEGDVQVFLLLVALGGAVLAGVRVLLRPYDRPAIVMADPFKREAFSTDTINIAHVRVAGLGGAGLVVAALIVALQFTLTTVAISIGVIGGLLGAVAVILSRRR